MGGEGVFQVFGDGFVLESGGRSLLLKKYDVFHNVSFHGISFLREGERGKMGERGRRSVSRVLLNRQDPLNLLFSIIRKKESLWQRLL